jgi:hypothetical protein
MEVFVLMSHILYECDELLGVYHNESDAEFARDEYKRENEDHMFDQFSIERRVIGAAARADWETDNV